jgi:hypothetical protein
LPDCNRCNAHRSAFIDDLLKEVTFVDSAGVESHISFMDNRMRWDVAAASSFGPSNQIFFYKQLKSCTRDYRDPDDPTRIWDWQLCFWLEETGTIQGGLKKLVLEMKGNSGRAMLETVGN